MTYNATYTSDDVAPVLIDGGTKILVQVGTLAAIIGLLAALAFGAWLMKKRK